MEILYNLTASSIDTWPQALHSIAPTLWSYLNLRIGSVYDNLGFLCVPKDTRRRSNLLIGHYLNTQMHEYLNTLMIDYFRHFSLETPVSVEKEELKPGGAGAGPEDAVGPAGYKLVDMIITRSSLSMYVLT